MSESNGYCSPFIGDGYDCEVRIPAAPGRWPEVRVRYRPLSADEESQVFYKHNKLGVSLVAAYADAFATKILDWDLKDRAGNKVPVTPENIRRLSPQFFDALRVHLDGSAPTPTGETQAETATKN